MLKFVTFIAEQKRRYHNQIWTPEMKERLLDGIRTHGYDMDKLATHTGIPTRQVRLATRMFQLRKVIPDDRSNYEGFNSKDTIKQILHRHLVLGHSFSEVGKHFNKKRGAIGGIVSRNKQLGQDIVAGKVTVPGVEVPKPVEKPIKRTARKNITNIIHDDTPDHIVKDIVRSYSVGGKSLAQAGQPHGKSSEDVARIIKSYQQRHSAELDKFDGRTNKKRWGNY